MARRAARQFRTIMGRQNTRASDTSSRASLERQFQSSMDDILRNLDEFVAEMDGVMPDILVEALEPTLGKSLELVPRDTGDLAASAYLEAEKFRGGARVVMGYGRGNNPDYAIFVHEMTEYKHEAPTQAKFLQQPLDEDYFSILNSIPRLVREFAGT